MIYEEINNNFIIASRAYFLQVDRAIMIEGKQQQIENRKRKYG